MKLLTGLSVFLLASGGSALAKECRIPDVPPGVRIQLPPGCEVSSRGGAYESEKPNHVRGNQGFIDLGNGTQIRVNGRVRAEVGVRR
jgi:hypothetical protein